MNRFQIWWTHFKLVWLGDAKFDKHGTGMIPCKHCGRMFRSYEHHDSDFGSVYDSLCEWCEFAMKDPRETKRAVEQILTDYESKVKDWDTAKAYLRAEGFNIRYAPFRCAWNNCELKGDEPTLGQVIAETSLDSWGSFQAQHFLINTNLKGIDRLCRRCFKLRV